MTEAVNVSVADTYLRRFARVVQRARRIGMSITQQLPSLGIFSGDISSELIPQLERVEGVSAVERTRTYRLPPDESKVQ
jgi:hypothetical protein